MKTVSAAVSSLEEARAKMQEELSIAVEVLDRLPSHEGEALRVDFATAANQIEEAQTAEELRAAFCRAIHNLPAHLLVCQDLSHIGRKFGRWLKDAEERVFLFEKKQSTDWLSFLQKWPRLWKAGLLSLLGLFDMGVGVGEAIERRIANVSGTSEKENQREKASLIRCWRRVEEGIDADTFPKLKTLLRRVRREREGDFLKKLRKDHLGPAEVLDVGFAEKAIGLEEFLLKVMVEMASRMIQEGGRVSTGLREFGYLQKVLEEHITVVGAEVAEASAINLVLETVKAEEKYLSLSRTWGKVSQKSLSDPTQSAARNREYHEAHCAIIDAYMELSDCKSLRGVMLCYELPIFTQLLYDQRKRLDTDLKESVIVRETSRRSLSTSA